MVNTYTSDTNLLVYLKHFNQQERLLMKKYNRRSEQHQSEFRITDIEMLKRGIETAEVDIDHYEIEFNPSHMVLIESDNYTACITITYQHLNHLFGVTEFYYLNQNQRDQLFDLIPNSEKYAETFIGFVDAKYLHRVKEDSLA